MIWIVVSCQSSVMSKVTRFATLTPASSHLVHLKCPNVTVLFGQGGCGGSKTSSLVTSSMAATAKAAVMTVWEMKKRFVLKGLTIFQLKHEVLLSQKYCYAYGKRQCCMRKEERHTVRNLAREKVYRKSTQHLILAVCGIATPLNKTSPIHILNWQPPEGWHSFTCCLLRFQFM